MRVGLELELPEGQHRERLLDALGNVVRRRGYEAFVSAPVLLPRGDYFPERWEPSALGAKRLLRRLMHYAGLGDLKLRLQTWREHSPVAAGMNPQRSDGHALAWFAGIHDDTCEFGLELDELRREESLVASLGHEVAHAYRDRHGLVVRDHGLEEKLTDLTCVYLGFGFFVLNSSHVVETGGYSATGEKMLYETHVRGYLTPAELALLLAAQLAVREDLTEQRAVLRELLPNHAALLEQGLESFAGDVDALRERLSVPGRDAWPARAQISELSPLPDDETADDDAEPDSSGSTKTSPGVAFRVTRDRSTLLGLLALGASVSGGAMLGAGPVVFYGLCGLATTAGFVVGRKLRNDECSACRARLRAHAAQCAECKAPIVGQIGSHEERLEALERLGAEEHDDSEPEEEDPTAVLFTAMLAAWGLSRGMIRDDASPAQRQLLDRVRAGDFDTEALYREWLESPLLGERAMRFAAYYCSEPENLREQDFALMSMANRVDGRPANYRRFAHVLDRRFAAWLAREDAGPQ